MGFQSATIGNVAVLRDGTFRTDPALVEELRAVVAPSYVDAGPLLARALARGDTLYLRRDKLGPVVAFFMVAWESLDVGGSCVPTAYLGLSATRQETKNTGAVRGLWLRFVREANEWQRSTGRRLLLWFTTATPSACFAAYKIFANAEPRPDGTFSESGAAIARALRARLGAPDSDGGHPFVLRGIAQGTRYSATERERIRTICEKRGFRLLHDLGVEEQRGDRLLYVCRIPD